MRFAIVAIASVSLVCSSRDGWAEDSMGPIEVVWTKPKLTGGTVVALEEALEKTREGVAACVATNGGLTSEEGRIDVQFLVRERGRAESVDVTRSPSVTSEASSCVLKLLKGRTIGTPSDDPVGVLFSYKLKRRS